MHCLGQVTPLGLLYLSKPDLDLLNLKDTKPCWLSRSIHDETFSLFNSDPGSKEQQAQKLNGVSASERALSGQDF